MKKKFVGLLLILGMVFGLLPGTALAADMGQALQARG